jgi:hypothetical protein
MDEAGSVWLREDGGNRCEKSMHFDLAMGSQTGGYAVKIDVVVAGVAHEFERSG